MPPEQAPSTPSPKDLTRLIPGYQVTALVSTRRCGTLYQARQTSLNRLVTIKVLPPEVGENATLRQAFEYEAKAMARLNHPNLVEVFDFGNTQNMLYIIMEHIPGRSLLEATHGNHVDPKESVRLVADLCHGLEHAHQARIIHRALNPSNILLNNKAQPKIVDFGIASLSGINPPGYSAPELPQQNSPQTDIFSAGMILYELIVGHLPTAPYTPPSSARHCLPEIDAVVYHSIQPNPHHRYRSAAEMAQALENILHQMDTPPSNPSS